MYNRQFQLTGWGMDAKPAKQMDKENKFPVAVLTQEVVFTS